MLCVVLLSGLFMLTSASVCPKQKHTDVPQFTQELGVEDMVRIGSSIAILCCSEGYDNITWHKKIDESWVPYPPTTRGNWNVPTLEEDNQLIRIHSAMLGDSTFFRCDLIKAGRSVKQHVTRIIVQNCDNLARGPILTHPFPKNQTIEKYGGNLTVFCTGYFGCGDGFRIVIWRVDNNRIKASDEKYVIREYYRNDNTTVGQSLTIVDVQASDLDKTYTCNLNSPQTSHPHTAMPVKISMKSKLPIQLVIGASVGGVVGVILIIVLLTRLWKIPRVEFFVRSRLPRLTPPPERGEKHYNGLLYHSADDTREAHVIRDQLEEKGYDIYISDDMAGNRSLGVYEEKVYQSLMVLFLYTDNLREDHFAHFLLQSLINNQKYRDILFLVVDEFVAENVMANTDSATNPDVRGNEMNDGSLEMDADNGDRGRADEDASVRSPNRDLSFWKALPRYKVPNAEASNSKKINFLCWLQNKIPKFQDQLKTPARQRRRTSSGRRLLDSHAEEGLSPPSTGRMSGNDDVFDKQYDGEMINEIRQRPDQDRVEADMIRNANNDEQGHMGTGNAEIMIMNNDIQVTVNDEQAAFYDKLTGNQADRAVGEMVPVNASGEMERPTDSLKHSDDTGEAADNQTDNPFPLQPFGDTSYPYKEPCLSEEHENLASASSGIGSLTSPMSSLPSRFEYSSDSMEHGALAGDSRPTSLAIDIKGTHGHTPNRDDVKRGGRGNKYEMTGMMDGTRGTPHKFSTRQSSGESGYETTPNDRALSPEYRENNVFSN